MNKRSETLKRGGPFAIGVLIGLSVVTPVFAATVDVEALPPYLLLGSLVVLLVCLILKAASMSRSSTRAKHSHSPTPGDLRWSEIDHSTDITLQGHVAR